VLSVTGLGFKDKTQTVDAVAPIAGPAMRPPDVVASSVSRGLASLQVTRTFATARSRITPGQGSVAIEYRLSQRDSQWTVYDVVLDGVSLVSNYREQFNSIIGTSSVAQLLKRMRTARSRRPQGRDAVGDATTAELETSTR
jgi:MlaC protein